jgi:metal-responsive CopG/Arc/MetJ family transcriptional regulator
MKTAISVPDEDFERFERVAQRHGMNRSEFYRLAAASFADRLEGGRELTALADAVIARTGQPSADGAFVQESARVMAQGTEW